MNREQFPELHEALATRGRVWGKPPASLPETPHWWHAARTGRNWFTGKTIDPDNVSAGRFIARRRAGEANPGY